MKKYLIPILFILLLVGCSNETYHNAIEKGLDYIASEDYEKAEAAFELALEEKANDEKATTLLNQVRNFRKALEAFDNGDLEEATEMAEKVVDGDEESTALVKKAEELLLEIEQLQTLLTEYTDDLQLAKKHFDEEKYDDYITTIEQLLNEDLSHPVFHKIKADAEKLQSEYEERSLEEEGKETKNDEEAKETKTGKNIENVEETVVTQFNPNNYKEYLGSWTEGNYKIVLKEEGDMVTAEYSVNQDGNTHIIHTAYPIAGLQAQQSGADGYMESRFGNQGSLDITLTEFGLHVIDYHGGISEITGEFYDEIYFSILKK